MTDATTSREFDGCPGLKRVKLMQKLVRQHGYFIYVRYHPELKTKTVMGLQFWTTTGTPWSAVEDTLRLNKLWPPIPEPPTPRKRKPASALDAIRQSMERNK